MTLPTVDVMTLDNLPTMRDARGALTVADFSAAIPFEVVRLFYVRDVPPGMVRGQHAHYRCSQYMLCAGGRLQVAVTDGEEDRSFDLSPGQGLHVPAGIFATETYLDPESVLLVLCDRGYEKDDYIHTLEDFCAWRREGPA